MFKQTLNIISPDNTYVFDKIKVITWIKCCAYINRKKRSEKSFGRLGQSMDALKKSSFTSVIRKFCVVGSGSRTFSKLDQNKIHFKLLLLAKTTILAVL
jgi:hypothetical protein